MLFAVFPAAQTWNQEGNRDGLPVGHTGGDVCLGPVKKESRQIRRGGGAALRATGLGKVFFFFLPRRQRELPKLASLQFRCPAAPWHQLRFFAEVGTGSSRPLPSSPRLGGGTVFLGSKVVLL